MNRLYRPMLAALSCAVLTGFARAEPAKIPVVIYHFQSPWSGIPESANVDGWHALATGDQQIGADTGVMAFVSKWHAAKKCWGSDRDCRPASWAVQQHLSYIGPISGASARIYVETKQ